MRGGKGGHLERKDASTKLGHGVRVWVHGLERSIDMVWQLCTAPEIRGECRHLLLVGQLQQYHAPLRANT